MKNEILPEQTVPSESSGCAGFLPMESAPKDGTTVELLLYHPNRKYADEDRKHEWEQIAEAKWLDFNGGGWTWRGMAGSPQGWRHNATNEPPRL